MSEFILSLAGKGVGPWLFIDEIKINKAHATLEANNI
jgi:hypothetical protein